MISLLGLGNNLLKYLKVIVVVQLRPVHEANLAVLKILNNLVTLGQRLKKPSGQTLDLICCELLTQEAPLVQVRF